MRFLALLVVSLSPVLFVGTAEAADLDANPDNLGTVLDGVMPGDVVHLAAGRYVDPIYLDLANGTAAAPIVIEGPTSGEAVFVADPRVCCNIFEIRDSSFVTLRNLVFDGASIDGVFGISAGGGDADGDGRNLTHDITIEDCRFVGFGGSNNHDAISTKTPTWGWIVRRNLFDAPGIGIYFGNSTGEAPFIGGRIEHNVFLDCLGYCMQIKWQLPRPTDYPGMPTGPSTTVIADNVFVHGDLPAEPRPNLLVGGFPMTGPGSDDRYEIARNLFVHNTVEPLLQASGSVSIHDNVFVDGSTSAPALLLRNHDLPLRRAWVYGNTFYTAGTAISVGAGDRGTSLVGNAIFAATPVTGTFDVDTANLRGSVAEAAAAFVRPSMSFGTMDFHPTSALPGIDLSAFGEDTLDGVDFECRPRAAPVYAGAYEGAASARTWNLAREEKPDLCGTEPLPDGGMRLDGGPTLDGSMARDAAGTDAGPPVAGAGCGCRASRAGGIAPWALGLIALLVVTRRRR